MFRGAFDVRAKEINEEMKIAVSLALANLISDEELKEIANRVERSGSHRSALDAECIHKNISMVNRLVITRLIFV